MPKNKETMHSRVPKGTSRSQLWMLNNHIKNSISYGTDNDINNLQLRLKSSLRTLRNTHQDQFEESLIEMEVVASKSPKIPAES